MDVRLSEEQRALRDAAAQVVDRVGPTAVAQIGEPERAARLHAAVTESGWRELRVAVEDGGPLASGVEVGIVAEELGRGAADVSFLGPTLAAELRRLAGAPPSSSVETVALDARLSSLVRGADGEWPAAVAIDTQGSSRALVLTRAGEGSRVAQVELRGAVRPRSHPAFRGPRSVRAGLHGRGCRSSVDTR